MPHDWTPRKHPLATYCPSCGRPLVPVPTPKDWRQHLDEYRAGECSRQAIPGATA